MRETQSGVISGWGPRARPVCLGPSRLSDTIDVGWDLKKTFFSSFGCFAATFLDFLFYFILFALYRIGRVDYFTIT